MPDLKSEMSKVLEAWEQDDQQTQQEKPVPTNTLPQIFKPTNNVSRETFNYVRDNPKANTKHVCEALGKRGLNPNSVGSLLTQFVKQGQMARDHNNQYITLVPEYTPLKSTKKFRSEGKRVNKIVSIKSKPKSEGIAALKVDTKPKVKPAWDVDTVLDTMSIVQARTLYDALKKIFGG
jgi:hypothetical protein